MPSQSLPTQHLYQELGFYILRADSLSVSDLENTQRVDLVYENDRRFVFTCHFESCFTNLSEFAQPFGHESAEIEKLSCWPRCCDRLRYVGLARTWTVQQNTTPMVCGSQ